MSEHLKQKERTQKSETQKSDKGQATINHKRKQRMKINPDKKITSATFLKNRSIRFLVGGEERMRIDKEGFYVDDRLVAHDLEIYEAFKDWLTQVTGCPANQGEFNQDLSAHPDE